MKKPSITVLRAKSGSEHVDQEARFLRLLTTAFPRSQVAQTIANALKSSGVVGRLILDEKGQVVLFDNNASKVEGIQNNFAVLTVLLVDEGTYVGVNKSALAELERNLEKEPWTPEVLVACVGQVDKAMGCLSERLGKRFQGASVNWLDLKPSGDQAESYWWHMQENGVDILTTGFSKTSNTLEKIRSTVEAAGLTITSWELDGENIENSNHARTLIVDLHEKWAFADATSERDAKEEEKRRSGAVISDAVPKSDDQQNKETPRDRFVKAIEKATQSRKEFRVVLPRNRTVRDIHKDIRAKLGNEPQLVPAIVFVSLSRQLERMSNEMRLTLTGLGSVEFEALGHRHDANQAELLAYHGAREVALHRLSLQEARSGGGVATRLDDLVKTAEGELTYMVDHAFEMLARQIKIGAYPGLDGKRTGVGARDAGKWSDHFPFFKHLSPKKTLDGMTTTISKDGNKNYVVSTFDKSRWPPSRIWDPRITIRPNKRLQKDIAAAIQMHCAAQITLLSIACQVYFAAVVRGESRPVLQQLFSDQKENIASRDPLPGGARRSSGLAGRRAIEVIYCENICNAVAIWPGVEKVPYGVNSKLWFKSISTLVRQGAKLATLVFLGLPFLDAAVNGAITNSLPNNKFNLGAIPQLSEKWGVNWWEIFGIAFLVALSLVGAGILELRSQQREKFQKLRDDTHRSMEDAAVKQLGVARGVFLDALRKDLDAFRADLQASIQSREGRSMRTLASDLHEIESRIEALKRKVDKTEKEEADVWKKVGANRTAAVRVMKRFFTFEGVSSK